MNADDFIIIFYPYHFEKWHGTIIDRSETGPQFNASSKGRHFQCSAFYKKISNPI